MDDRDQDQDAPRMTFGEHLRRLHAARCLPLAEFDEHGRCIACAGLPVAWVAATKDVARWNA
jgi:hypothetical protein